MIGRLRGGRAAAVALAGCTAVLIAACGGGSAASPSASSSASHAASAPGDTSSPVASGDASGAPTGEPSPAPSFTRVPDLEALLPATVRGVSLKIASESGVDVQGAPLQTLQNVLGPLGAKPGDYALAYARNDQIGLNLLAVWRVAGVDAVKLEDSIIAESKRAAGGMIVLEAGTIGGKKVTIVRTTQNETFGSYYFWPSGKVLFQVLTTDPTLAEDVLKLLK